MGALIVPARALPTFPGGLPLTGIRFPSANGHNLPIGDNDLYTVPANKRASICSLNGYNASAGTIDFFHEIKKAGIYYRVRSTQSLPTNASVTQTNYLIILEAGDSYAINVATNNGLNVFPNLVEFDDTANIKTAILLALNLGDNTIYTCPPNTTAKILGVSNELTFSGVLNYTNTTGLGVIITSFVVPFGGVPDITNKATISFNVANNVSSNPVIGGTLNAGDFVSINVNSGAAGQIAWVNVMETPN